MHTLGCPFYTKLNIDEVFSASFLPIWTVSLLVTLLSPCSLSADARIRPFPYNKEADTSCASIIPTSRVTCIADGSGIGLGKILYRSEFKIVDFCGTVRKIFGKGDIFPTPLGGMRNVYFVPSFFLQDKGDSSSVLQTLPHSSSSNPSHRGLKSERTCHPGQKPP